MIKFEKLKLKNFLSFGNNDTVIPLDFSDPILIMGENHDCIVDGQLDSNGSGKSTILEAISFCLYDRLLNDSIKKNSIINNVNKKNLETTLIFTKDNIKYKITRFRKNKAFQGGNGVIILKNFGTDEEKDITPDSTNNANQLIADIINIPFNIFNKMIAYVAGSNSFVTMSLADQRAVIEELFGCTELTKKAEKLKEVIKETQKNLDYSEDINSHIKESNENHKRQILEAENNIREWEEDINSHIKESNENHKRQILEAENNIREWDEDNKEKIKKYKNDLNTLNEIDIEKEEKQIKLKDSLLSEIKDLKQKKQLETNQLESIKSKLEQCKKHAQWEESHKEKLSSMEDKIQEHDKEIEYDSEKEKLDKLTTIKNTIETLNSDGIELEASIKKYEEKINKGVKELEHLEKNECPYCLQQFEEAKDKIEHITSENKKIESSLNEYRDTLADVQKDIANKKEEYNTILEKCIFTSINELDSYVSELKHMVKELQSIKNESNPYDKLDEIGLNEEMGEAQANIDNISLSIKDKEESYNNIETVFDNIDELNEIKIKITKLETQIEELKSQSNPYEKSLQALKDYNPKESKDEEIKELRDNLEHQQFLLKLLTKKDSFLRQALLNTGLPFLNKRLSIYLKGMGLPHSVMFLSDLSISINQFGEPLEFGGLSSGQKARVNLALSLAFRDVLQAKHGYINLYVLDECLDVGLGNVGVQLATKAIKEVANANKLSMFVISHRDEVQSMFNKKLLVKLKNGFSTIERL